jgi:hypothetical protein
VHSRHGILAVVCSSADVHDRGEPGPAPLGCRSHHDMHCTVPSGDLQGWPDSRHGQICRTAACFSALDAQPILQPICRPLPDSQLGNFSHLQCMSIKRASFGSDGYTALSATVWSCTILVRFVRVKPRQGGRSVEDLIQCFELERCHIRRGCRP